MDLQTALQNLRNKRIAHGQSAPVTSQKLDELPVSNVEKNGDEQRRAVAVPSSTTVCRATGASSTRLSPSAAHPGVSESSLQRLKTFKFTKLQIPPNKSPPLEREEEHASASKRRAVCRDTTNADKAAPTGCTSIPLEGSSFTSAASPSTVIDRHGHGHAGHTIDKIVSLDNSVTSKEVTCTLEGISAGGTLLKASGVLPNDGGMTGGINAGSYGGANGRMVSENTRGGLPPQGTRVLPVGANGIPPRGTSGILPGGTSGVPAVGTSGILLGGTNCSDRVGEFEAPAKEELFDDFDVDTFLADIDPDDALGLTDVPSSLPHSPPSTTLLKTVHQTLKAVVSTSSDESSDGIGPALPVAHYPRKEVHLEATSIPSRKSPDLAVCRRFPGPAGLLPRLGPGQSIEKNAPPLSSRLPSVVSHVQRTTGATYSPSGLRGWHDNIVAKAEGDPMDFTKGPWVRMMEDLDMSDPHSAALLQFTVAALLKQASRRQLQNGKVAHLRVMLKCLSPTSSKGNASAVLADPTGEVVCALHHKVVEEHQRELTPGAVMVLRQVSVFSPAPRKHYLSITPDNIIRIYPAGSEDAEKRPLLLSEVNKKRTSVDGFRQEGPVVQATNTVGVVPRQNKVESVASVFTSALCDDDEFDQLFGDVSEGLDF
ncbi:hypothetical protein EMCRGX_G012586 [Ephydatia muelleri]